MSGSAPAARGGPWSGLATVIATGLGAGYSPVAPGTAGSLVGLLLFWPLAGTAPAVQAAAIVVGFLVGVAASTDLARRLGRKDPGRATFDEVVGMWATMAFLPFDPLLAAAGFLVFRIMDVVKPWPARQLEALPDGWGIMADDLMAGIYGNLLLRVVLLALGPA